MPSGYRSVSKNKENRNLNESKQSTGDLISNKFSKFMHSKKTQIMNSNNINIRRNYGSSDSQQAAPAQHKYVANEFKSKNKTNLRKENKDQSPSFSNFLARN